MCGIFGVVNPRGTGDTNKLRDFFQQATITGMLRGMHATGVMQIDYTTRGKRQGQASIYYEKAAVTGLEFVMNSTQQAEALLKDAGRCFLTVGHNRAATHGAAAEDDNAHPFMHTRPDGSSLIGVHNGTLTTWYAKYDGKEFKVDSDYLYYRIAKDGPKEVLKELNGAAALVWFDSKHSNKFFMYTNGGRPLHFAFVEGGPQRMLIASEPGMLSWLAERNDIKLVDNRIYVCKSRRLYTFSDAGADSINRFTHEDIPYSASTTTTTTTGTGVMRHMGRTATTRTQRQEMLDRLTDLVFLGQCAAKGGGSTKDKQKSPADQIADAIDGVGSDEDIKRDLDKAIWDAQQEEAKRVEAKQAAPAHNVPASPIITEQKTLKELDLVLGAEATFEASEFIPYTHDSEHGELHGEVLVEHSSGVPTDINLFYGIVRYISKREAMDAINKVAIVRMLGARLTERTAPLKGVDPVIVVSKPTSFLTAHTERTVN